MAALAAYATLAVGGWCPYCAVIYALTLFAFLEVSLMHSQRHLEKCARCCPCGCSRARR